MTKNNIMRRYKSLLILTLAAALIHPRGADARINMPAYSADALTTVSNTENYAGMNHMLRILRASMYSRSEILAEIAGNRYAGTEPQAYSILCDVVMNTPGYVGKMNQFLKDNPQSALAAQIRFCHASNLFDEGRYAEALEVFDILSTKKIAKCDRSEYLFKKGYCSLENGNSSRALDLLIQVDRLPLTDFTAPARYTMGYIHYTNSDFEEAIKWFEQSVKDDRFTEISEYYLLECHFMLKDYEYVTDKGIKMYEAVPEGRKPHLARIISESYLVLGDPVNARKYYNFNQQEGGKPKTRADWFYSGSVLYAVEDYKGAIDNFNMMGMRADSIGQIANYHLGYSYIQTKNKVAALDAFKDAAMVHFDEDMAQDAYFNYAKLAFDLNTDTSVFRDYLQKYSDVAQGDRINAYIAVAALYNRDYEGAVEAYDKIDDLDPGMKSNYMKANYLRAEQLISSGSYRLAVPCLRTAAYYSEKGSRINQLTRFWLAEAYYRNDQYDQALDILTDLYNVSAMHGMPEGSLIPYNIAYCKFDQADYNGAVKWFGEYLDEPKTAFRKEALTRMADSYFIMKDYKNALSIYNSVLDNYLDVNDIYPYYQAGICYGLLNDSKKKIELLSHVNDASTDAKFYPEAMFELGRSYAVKEDDENAFKCFNTIAEVVKDSTFVAKAYIEMGSLARNQSQFNEALGYYKTVVEQMPLSGCAEDALLAIESIYQTRNTPEEYLAYIDSIGKGATKTEDEKESMIFNSAEQIFLSENYQKALVALKNYTDKYPDGQYVYKADFYMAESYKHLGKSEQACDCYKRVIEGGEGSFVELSMLNFASISYRLEHWDEAYGAYSSLLSSAKLESNTFEALKGMMRSAYRGHKVNESIKSADNLMADPRCDKALKEEAEYIKAKSYLSSSRRDEAFSILERLSEDTKSAYGAEAAYLIILDCYDSGRFEDVQTKVYAFADSGSSQNYWLAKSFIVLGDSFVESGQIRQARATFESVRDGYKSEGAGDDVMDNIRMRLKKLDEMESNRQ